jgi:hypothetical protein
MDGLSDVEWSAYLDANPDIRDAIKLRQISEGAYRRQAKEIIRLKKLVGEMDIKKYVYRRKNAGLRPITRKWSLKQKLQILRLRDDEDKSYSEIATIMNLSNKRARTLYCCAKYIKNKVNKNVN